jgi:hypothetical protein
LKEGLKAGLLPTEVYRMTPHELNVLITARSVQENEKNIKVAWHTINFLNASFSEKFLDLSEYLLDDDEPEQKHEPGITPGVVDAFECAKRLGLPYPDGY